MAGHDRTTAEGRRFFKEIEDLTKLQVRVGFTSGGSGYGANSEPVTAKDYEDGPTIVEVAAWNEFGTYNTPPRPFLRQSVENYTEQISVMCKAQLQAIASGKQTAESALKAIGALQVGLVQHTIRDGGFEPNAPITIQGGWMRNQKSGKPFYVKGKGSSRPLIDTGRMRQSVHYVIKPKGDD